MCLGCGADAEPRADDALDAATIDPQEHRTFADEADAGRPQARVQLSMQSTAFDEGSPLPIAHTCDGDNVSPPLTWRGAPEGTKSFVLALTDLDTTVPHDPGPLVLWALFDIPSAFHSLPADVGEGAMPSTVPGARQVRAFSAFGGAVGGSGYFGPCARESHRYAFTLFALDVETLVEASTDQQPREILQQVVESDHVLALARLETRYEPVARAP